MCIRDSNIYGRGGNDEDGGNETDDEEYESELMSFLLAQRQRYAITHRIVLKECLIDNINVSGGAHCDAFDCIIRKNSNDEKQTCVSVEKDSFLTSCWPCAALSSGNPWNMQGIPREAFS